MPGGGAALHEAVVVGDVRRGVALRPVEVTNSRRNSVWVLESPEGLSGQARGTSTTSWAAAGPANGRASTNTAATRRSSIPTPADAARANAARRRRNPERNREPPSQSFDEAPEPALPLSQG